MYLSILLKRFYLVFVVLFLLSPLKSNDLCHCKSADFNKPICTNKIDEIYELIKTIKPVLVVFDCDATLLRYTDSSMSPRNCKKFMVDLSKSNSNFEKQMSSVFNHAEIEAVDQGLINMYNDIQTQLNIPCLIISQCGNGSFGEIESMIDWRIEQVKKVGIILSDLLQDDPSLVDKINDFYSSYVDPKKKRLCETSITAPYYKEGIINSVDIPKWNVLENMLNILIENNRFESNGTIIFIDDSTANCNSFLESASKSKLFYNTIAINYTMAYEAGANTLKDDVKHLQNTILQKYDIWVPDDVAGILSGIRNCVMIQQIEHVS